MTLQAPRLKNPRLRRLHLKAGLKVRILGGRYSGAVDNER